MKVITGMSVLKFVLILSIIVQAVLLIGSVAGFVPNLNIALTLVFLVTSLVLYLVLVKQRKGKIN